MGSLGEAKGRDMASSISNPVVIELQRLENNIREKERELRAAHSEIKALKVTESLKDKANVELSNEISKLEGKLTNAEEQLENKNLVIKKQIDEKKQALAAQFAAEATVRRVHANQRSEEPIPIDSIKARYESDIRMYKTQIATLKEDIKALESLIKSKEVALVVSRRNLDSAHESTLMVKNLQNQNVELKKKIEIFQEENKLVEKTNRQKVAEVKKLAQTIQELEESISASGASANVIRDYQRQFSELKEDKRTLERELARFKVAANHAATVVANEWKDESVKVIPIKQWLEERKILQGEIKKLQDKLDVSQRTMKAEAQVRDKLQLRLKMLENGLKFEPTLSNRKVENTEEIREDKVLNEGSRKISTTEPEASFTSHRRSNGLKMKLVNGENQIKKNIWASKENLSNDIGKENSEAKTDSNINLDVITPTRPVFSKEVKEREIVDVMSQNSCEDSVSGFLYDKIQKELIVLRKQHEEKDGVLISKDEKIKSLQRKVDALSKTMDEEFKKVKKQTAARENEKLAYSDDGKQKNKTTTILKRLTKTQGLGASTISGALDD